MGRSGSSSKRKHSKKKSHKVSSEVRKKKKIRRNKSKKLRVHDDSFSSCSDDESTSSSVFSSSSSENEYKTKKSRSRSRARIEVKRSKKRIRKRSLSEDSSSEDSSPVKKRKRSRKKSKKIKKEKKPKRDSYNYTSSSNSSSDDVASRGRSTKGKIGNMKNRSRSSSLPSNSYDDENVEDVAVETNSRRLKSVITVVNQEHEEQNDMKKEEEIVYDYDDYPSCKSNDSNEIVDFVDRFDVSGNVGSEVDDLESILRKKALENLSKFREAKKPVVSVDDKNKSGQTSVDHGQQLVNQRSRFTWRRDSSATTGKEEPGAAYGGPQSSGSQLVVPKNKIVNEISEIRADTSTNDSSGGTGANIDQKSTPASTNVDQKSTPASSNVDQKSTPASTNVDQKSTPASTEAGSSNQKQDEFEKKTMTVMRGGELVQVSYKVYIPNKAPALARRQLKR